MDTFQKNLIDYLCSGHCLLHVSTFEKDRAINRISEAAKQINRTVHIWSVATGWKNDQGVVVSDAKPGCPVEESLMAITEFPQNTVCILQDFDCYLRHETYPGFDIIISWLNELRQMLSTNQQSIIFVGPAFEPPIGLKHDITMIDFALPDTNQIEAQIMFSCEDVMTKDGKKFEPNLDLLPQIVAACRGMTQQQTIDRATLTLRKHGDFNEAAIKTITREKAAVVNASGLLTYIEPPEGGLSIVGGYSALKQHVQLDKPCFTTEAREFGIEFPRGIMLVGIPGCGKTLLSLAIASELGLPLIAMDVGNLMSKYVGESELHMREAIGMLESIAPCVLVLDEIEKGFGGVGDMDGGASRRVFGTFLKWMNDRTSPVYIVATANQVQSLPPEFSRKGRFDEIYGLDLPATEEREEIFRIHIAKRDRKPDDFDLEKLANTTPGYTGADIEQIVKLGLKVAFSAKLRQLQTEHLLQCVEDIIPLSQTEEQRIKNVRDWCSRHAKPANPPIEKISKGGGSNRKVTLN